MTGKWVQIIVIWLEFLQQTTPTNSFSYKIPMCGSYPNFNIRINCYALENEKNFRYT